MADDTPDYIRRKREREKARYHADPDYRARILDRQRAYREHRHAHDPEFAAYLRQKSRESYWRKHPEPGKRGRPRGPEPAPRQPAQPKRTGETMRKPRPQRYNHVGAAAVPAQRAKIESRPPVPAPAPIAFADLPPLQQHDVEAMFLRLCDTIADIDERLAAAGLRVLGVAVVWE